MAITVGDLKPGTRVSFQTNADSVLGGNFTNLMFDGIVGYRTAAIHEDVAAVHASVIVFLDTSVPEDHREIRYAMFIDHEGKSVVVGVPYINEETLTVVDSLAYQFTVENCAIGDDAVIKQLLASIGKHAVESKIIG